MTDDFDRDPDPAAIAAETAEPTAGDASAPIDPVYAVGIGPGSSEYLTPRGHRAIRAADVVVGFRTVVDFVADVADAGTELLTCGYEDEGTTLAAFGGRVADGATGAAVLMGDPNHSGYQFLGKVQRVVEAAAPTRGVRVIPGISSLQLAASRARTPMEESEFVTLHKRGNVEPDLDRLRANAGDRHLLVLPRPYDWMPEDVATELLASGADPSLQALVFEQLTHEDEAIHRFSLSELAATGGGDDPDASPFSDLSVLVIRREVTVE